MLAPLRAENQFRPDWGAVENFLREGDQAGYPAPDRTIDVEREDGRELSSAGGDEGGRATLMLDDEHVGQ